MCIVAVGISNQKKVVYYARKCNSAMTIEGTPLLGTRWGAPAGGSSPSPTAPLPATISRPAGSRIDIWKGAEVKNQKGAPDICVYDTPRVDSSLATFLLLLWAYVPPEAE